MVSGKYSYISEFIIFKLILLNDVLNISCEHLNWGFVGE